MNPINASNKKNELNIICCFHVSIFNAPPQEQGTSFANSSMQIIKIVKIIIMIKDIINPVLRVIFTMSMVAMIISASGKTMETGVAKFFITG